MSPRAHKASPLWSVVLAGGNGSRMRTYVERRFRRKTPKQYLAFTGTRSMFEHTLDRAETLVPQNRIVSVIDAGHAAEAEAQLAKYAFSTVLRQPKNLDTAPGVLLALSAVLDRDPDARVALLPADHFILEERRFMKYVSAASVMVQNFPNKIILLGVIPDRAESDYGYIQPGHELDSLGGATLRRVTHFHEKPDLAGAQEYFQDGYLWNTFVIVARAATLYARIVEHLPQLGKNFRVIRGHWRDACRDFVLAREYRKMSAANLSAQVFSRIPEHIAVMPVWGVHWSDWGSGTRVDETLRGLVPRGVWSRDPIREPIPRAAVFRTGSETMAGCA